VSLHESTDRSWMILRVVARIRSLFRCDGFRRRLDVSLSTSAVISAMVIAGEFVLLLLLLLLLVVVRVVVVEASEQDDCAAAAARSGEVFERVRRDGRGGEVVGCIGCLRCNSDGAGGVGDGSRFGV
jgi:hypothetical protein